MVVQVGGDVAVAIPRGREAQIQVGVPATVGRALCVGQSPYLPMDLRQSTCHKLLRAKDEVSWKEVYQESPFRAVA